MKSPYQILGITTGCTDSEVKQAYLQQVKNNPPDKDPQQFQVIHKAYDSIKDHKSRISYDLFTFPTADFDELLDLAFSVEPSEPVNPDHLMKLLRESLDESTLLNTISEQPKQ